MGVRTVVASAAAPLVYRFFSSRERKGKTPEDAEHQPLFTPVPTYAGDGAGRSSVRGSPERFRRDSGLDRVPEELDDAPVPGTERAFEEADEDPQWDLEEQGLYTGSYRRVVAAYTLVPVSCLLMFAVFAVLPRTAWHAPSPSPVPSPSFHGRELLLSAALWALAHLLRVPLFTLASALLPPFPAAATVLSTAAHVLLQTLLRLSSFALLPVHLENHSHTRTPSWRDPAFGQAWWLALGWAAADAAVGIAQGYAQISLYRAVLLSEEQARELVLRYGEGLVGQPRHGKIFLTESPLDIAAPGEGVNGSGLEEAVERDLEALVALKTREELEEVYGVPVIKIPVFVSALQRIDAIILSVGLTLLLAAAYLRSSLAITLPAVLLVHLALALLYTPPVLPRIGVHTAAYVGLLAGLGCLFAGLGMWGALS